MSIQAQPAAMFAWQREIRGKLPSHVGYVALTLSTYANKSGGSIHPGQARLCEATGLSRSSVARAIKWLEAEGWIICVQTGGKGSGRSGFANVYQLSVPEKHVSSDEGACVAGDTPPAQLSHHSESLTLAHSASGPPNDNEDDWVEDWIADQVDGFSDWEASTTMGMLSQGVHPQVIVNTINKHRAA